MEPTPEAIANEYLARNGQTDIGRNVSRAIDLVKDHFGPLVGGTLLVILASIGLALIPLLGSFAAFILGGVFQGGLSYMFIRRIRGEQVTAGDAFVGFSVMFVQLILAGIVKGLITAVGFFLCLLPGIYLAVGYSYALPLVIDRKLEFWTAMEVSRRVVHRHWWTIFGLAIVAALIAVVGVLACGIGVFVTVPVAIAAMMYAYEDLFPAGAVSA